jgi:hypothetical protein
VTALLQRRKFCRADSVCDLCDVYFYSHFHVDAEGSIPLTHGLGYVIYGLTLNNDVGFYQASPQYMIRREYYRLAVAAGFRWSPTPSRPYLFLRSVFALVYSSVNDHAEAGQLSSQAQFPRAGIFILHFLYLLRFLNLVYPPR